MKITVYKANKWRGAYTLVRQ